MDDQQTQQDSSQQTPSVNPWPIFGKTESTFDISAVKPHKCMDDIIQRGNYIHCNTGSHGMRIPHGKQLVKDAHGEWDLIDIPVRDAHGKIIAPNYESVVD